jgi:hypothetical protein
MSTVPEGQVREHMRSGHDRDTQALLNVTRRASHAVGQQYADFVHA